MTAYIFYISTILYLLSVCIVTRSMLSPRKPQSFKTVDLRSDTLTRPTPAMRKAMFEAEVGDDVFCEDPTVNALEARTATILNKESALFFPTGTMANLAAVMGWCGARGSEMILGDSSHIFLFEQAGTAQIAGVSPRILPNKRDGTINIEAIEAAIRADNIHFPTTELIALENTHNYCGGRVLPKGFVESVSLLAHQNEVPVHLDGARIWNAAVASSTPVATLAEPVDSISVCLSKGLGAPVGSLLVGPKKLISKARRIRKVLGGGMRQAGVLAAAGMQALNDFESGILQGDHKKAFYLADRLSVVPGLRVEPNDVDTNIVLVHLDLDSTDPVGFSKMLKEMGVLVLPFGPRSLRVVTHRGITDEDINYAVLAFRDVAARAWTETRLLPSADGTTATSSTPLLVPNEASTVAEVPKSVVGAEVKPVKVEGGKPTNDTLQAKKEEKVVHYEEVKMYGMSVGKDGFSVLLRGTINDHRFVRVAVTPADPMADGLDIEDPGTPEAVTLLQLFQGIDIETYLPKGMFASKFGMQQDMNHKYVLKRVLIDKLNKMKTFNATLLGIAEQSGGMESEQNKNTSNVSVRDLKTVTVELNPVDTMSSSDIQAENNINASSKNVNNGGKKESVEGKEQIVYGTDQQKYVIKRVDVNSAFEALALALRHHAVIEVRASLLFDEDVSYPVENAEMVFPKLVLADAIVGTMEAALREKYPPEVVLRDTIARLKRRMVEAKRQGNMGKVEEIQHKLDYYTNKDISITHKAKARLYRSNIEFPTSKSFNTVDATGAVETHLENKSS